MAAFLVGSVVATFAWAEPEDCNWDFRADTTATGVGRDGADTAQAALEELVKMNRHIEVPVEAIRVNSRSNDRAVLIGSDADGGVGFNVYIDDVHRIIAYVESQADGTYHLGHFSTCLGV